MQHSFNCVPQNNQAQKRPRLRKCQNAALILGSVKRLLDHRMRHGGIDVTQFFFAFYILTECETGFYPIRDRWQRFEGHGTAGLRNLLAAYRLEPTEDDWQEAKRMAAVITPYPWLRSRIGGILQLTQEERVAAEAWNLIPIDRPSRQLKEERRARKIAACRASRARQRASRPPPRIPLSQSKPWESEGISRRAWYYRKQRSEALHNCASTTLSYIGLSTPGCANSSEAGEPVHGEEKATTAELQNPSPQITATVTRGGINVIDLWPHQVRSVNAVFQSLRTGHRSPILQVPVRGGKTRIAAKIAELGLRKNKKMIFTVPLLSLVDQAVAAFEREGIQVGVIQGRHSKTDWRRPIQICSVQTLVKREVPDFDLAIPDEAHVMYKGLINIIKSSGKPVIGLSATPWSRGLGKVYDDLVIGPSMRELMELGILTKYQVWAPENPDLDEVKDLGDDFHKGQLAHAMNKPRLIGNIVKTWIDKAEGRGTLLFAVNRAHAQEIHKCFELQGVPASYVDGMTDRDDRTKLKERYDAGDVRVIVSIGVFKMGVDWDFRAVIDAQPTKSEMSFVQRLGRGLTAAEGKEDCWIFDHAGNHHRMGRFMEDIFHERLSQGERIERTGLVKKEAVPKFCPDCHAVAKSINDKCPACGHEWPKRRNSIETIDGELVPIGQKKRKENVKDWSDTRQVRQSWYGQLLWIAEQRGYKYAWVRHKYFERFGNQPYKDGLLRTPEPPDTVVLSFVRKSNIRYAKVMKEQERIPVHL